MTLDKNKIITKNVINLHKIPDKSEMSGYEISTNKNKSKIFPNTAKRTKVIFLNHFLLMYIAVAIRRLYKGIN